MIIILIAITFSFSLFTYGEKVVTIKLSKYESQYLMKLIDSCFCDNGEKYITKATYIYGTSKIKPKQTTLKRDPSPNSIIRKTLLNFRPPKKIPTHPIKLH
jgi:hypothetical protein